MRRARLVTLGCRYFEISFMLSRLLARRTLNDRGAEAGALFALVEIKVEVNELALWGVVT